MNIILIGNNLREIGRDIWECNKEFSIIEILDITNKNFIDYIKNKKVILLADSSQFVTFPINDLLDYFNKHKLIPVFIADNEKSFEVRMYYTLAREIQDSLLYIHNEKHEKTENYKELIDIIKGYLFNKGLIDDKFIRTSNRRTKKVTNK